MFCRILSCLAVLGFAASAAAAPFDVNLFHPTATADGYVSVDGAFVLPHLGWSAGLFVGYAHAPLVLRLPDGTIPPNGAIISHQLTLDATASVGFFGRLELGVDLPVVAYQRTESALVDAPVGSYGLGDLQLDLKILILPVRFQRAGRFGFSVVVGGSAPTGSSSALASEAGWTGRPRLVAEWRAPHDRVSAGLSLGAVLRAPRDAGNLHVTDQLSYGAGVRVGIVGGLSALGELAGLVGIALPQDEGGLTASELPLQVMGGLAWRSRFGLELLAAGGTGLTHGYGSPDGRALFGVRYASPPRPRRRPVPAPTATPAPTAKPVATPAARPKRPPRPAPSDRDHDGIPDAVDRCPDRAGIADNEGCPDFDSDGDGLVDRLDKCPFEAEIYNDFEDEDGCPDAGAPLAVLEADRIRLLAPVRFIHHGADVDERSYPVLRVVARMLRLHKEIVKVRILGAHADTVRAYFVQIEAIDPKRIEAVPVDRKSRRDHRRIEVEIVQRWQQP